MLQQPLDYLFSPPEKPLHEKMIVVTRKVTIKGFYLGEVTCDLGSSVNMMSLSLFNKIGGLELKTCEVRI
jgi:hypothetical protein